MAQGSLVKGEDTREEAVKSFYFAHLSGKSTLK
jgi:hypothetical protein